MDVTELTEKLGVAPIQFSFAQASSNDEFNAVFNGVCQGFTAYSQGDYEEATQLLLPVRGNLRVLGGTAVEHELVDLLLVEW